jgi:two-component system cell cycle response regulator DivK
MARRHAGGRDMTAQRTILYIEDNEYNRKIVRQLLTRTTYRLIEANDGETGVEMAQKELPALILMDVQLPRMSGLDATRLLKGDARTSAIPIIIITSFALSGDREKAAAAGADSYLAKPYSPRELLALVRQYLPETAG